MAAAWIVDDRLWAVIEPLLPVKAPGTPGQARMNDRLVLQGILFVLITGIGWEDLPQELGFGSGMTCWRRLRDWQAAGVFEARHETMLAHCHRAGFEYEGGRRSVGPVGSSYYNALAETINGPYKTELIKPRARDPASNRSSSPPRNGSTGSTPAPLSTAAISRRLRWK